MTTQGPFPMPAVVLALSALPAWWLARTLTRRLPIEGRAEAGRHAGTLLIDALLLGLLAARIGYVLRWWSEYAASPRSITAIGDGGFLWWPGLAAAVAFGLWRTRTSGPRSRLRAPLLLAGAIGIGIWLALTGALTLFRPAAPPLPDLVLTTLDGRPTGLHTHGRKPIVLNLWATWCPPCRREMPVFQDAQARYPDVAIVLLNQGEDATVISEFLHSQRLDLDHVLLDPTSRAMHETRSRVLPTTLFFDADGRLVDRHTGELTRASLADTLLQQFGITAVPDG